jgi:23S rRNA A1618 N6-methylase RlmF
MCNPPFYSSRTAMRISAAMKSGTPRGALTAGEAELLAPGGEVTFVGRMVDESIRAQTRCLYARDCLLLRNLTRWQVVHVPARALVLAYAAS